MKPQIYIQAGEDLTVNDCKTDIDVDVETDPIDARYL